MSSADDLESVMTFHQRVCKAAEFRAKCQCSTAQPDLDKAIRFYLRVGFEDGARFGFDLAAQLLRESDDRQFKLGAAQEWADWLEKQKGGGE